MASYDRTIEKEIIKKLEEAGLLFDNLTDYSDVDARFEGGLDVALAAMKLRSIEKEEE